MSTAKKPLRESDVLHPRDPAITNDDDWPEFRLTNGAVTLPPRPNTRSISNATSGEAVSLLLAGEHNPVTITGQLEPPSKNQAGSWLSKPSSRNPVTIEVSDVVSFSYGAYEDGSVELWAAGRAGWFVIRPSKIYQRIYDEMIEAVKILFFIVDAYTTPRKRGKGKNATILPDYTAQELFEKYAVEVMGVEKGAPEAAKKMYKHREFLLGSMIEGKEGVVWGKNPLYLHLCRKFAEEAKKIRQRRAAAAAVKEKEVEKTKIAPAQQHTRQASFYSTSTTSSLKRKRGRPPKDVISVGSSSVADSSTVEVKPAQTAKTKGAPKFQRLAKPSRRTRSNPAPSTPEIQESQPTTPAVEQESDSEVPRPRRKSALRLKPNKPTKGPPKKSSKPAPALGNEEDEEDEEEDEAPIVVTVNGGKRKRGHTLSNTKAAEQTRTIRPAKRANSNSRSSRSRIKHAAEAEAVDEGIDIPTSPSSDDAVGGADPSNAEDLPLHLLHHPDPLQNNVWTCALDGCTHKVYSPPGGSSADPEVQKLIREHYTLHAYDDDERVRMVKGMAEPSLPINYLVERVRGQVRLEGMGFVGSSLKGVSTRYPEAVVTKF